MGFLTILALCVSLFAPLSATPAAAASCQFVLGFATIQSMIPTLVGSCLTDEQYASNGDGLQQTTGRTGARGLLVWRKLDNWTAFTDGYRTWVNGPNGLQERLNIQRFCWEGDASLANCLSQSAPSTSSSSSSTASVSSSSSSSGSSSQVIVSSVQGGSNSGTASITIHAAPNTPCNVTYVTPDGTVSEAPGLSPKATDSNGNASWSWSTGTRSYPGTVTVTCGGATATAGIPVGS